MNMSLKRSYQFVVLFFTWFLFSPLFLFFSIRWRKPKMFLRLILAAVAPFTLGILLLFSVTSYRYYYQNIQRGGRAEIETKTGLYFPKYSSITQRHNIYNSGFNGDFTMGYFVMFDTANIKEFYHSITGEIESGNSIQRDSLFKSWMIDKEGNYSFSYNDFQEFLELEINRETGEMKIMYGDL